MTWPGGRSAPFLVLQIETGPISYPQPLFEPAPVISGAINQFAEFHPYVPAGRVERWNSHFTTYDSTYKGLLSKYYANLAQVCDATNVDFDTINYYRNLAGWESLDPQYLGLYRYPSDVPRWPNAVIIPRGTPWTGYTPQVLADSMCLGLAYWQMLAITYYIGVLRITQFHYFGRPKHEA